jgi:hypothetical protein
MIHLRGVLFSVAALLSVACGAKVSNDAVGGETHWLAVCDASVGCKNGFDCICGRCTEACGSTKNCEQYPNAVCAAAQEVAFASSCRTTEKLCARVTDVSVRDADAGLGNIPLSSSSNPLPVSTVHSQPSSVVPSASASVAAAVDCRSVSVQDCGAHPECKQVMGFPVDTYAECISTQAVAIGCDSAENPCVPPPVIWFGKNSSGQCYSTAHCLPSGFTDARNECDFSEPCPSTLIPDGHYPLLLEVHPSFSGPEQQLFEAPKTWWINLDVTLKGGQATVWLAATGEEVQLTNGTRTTYTTEGSTGDVFQVQVSSRSMHLIGVELKVSPNETLNIDTLSLISDNGSVFPGEVFGQRVYGLGDQVFTTDFSSQFTGVLDTVPATLSLGTQVPLIPPDTLSVALSEPIQQPNQSVLKVTGGANGTTALSATLAWTEDARPGFVRALRVEPQGLWPSGAVNVELKTRDAAGNEAIHKLGPVLVPVAPDTAANLGFEQATAGWLGAATAAAQFVVNSETPLTITAPEGGSLAKVPAGTRIAGHLEAPLDATQICVTGGIGGGLFIPKQINAGVRLVLVTASQKRTFDKAVADFSNVTTPATNWSGFTELCADLPDTADQGFWFTAEATGSGGQLVYDLLLDDVRFR